MHANRTGVLACAAALAVLAGCGGSSKQSHGSTAPVTSAAAAPSPSPSSTTRTTTSRAAATTSASTATRQVKRTATSTAVHSTAAVTSTQAARTTARSTRARKAPQPAVGLHLQTPPGQPRAGVLWPITVTSVPAEDGVVSYEFLYNGTIVSRQPGGPMHAGVYHDKLRFPARAVGFPVTLRVVLRMPSGQIVHTDHAVSVQR